uniref:Uncharacterized protein n=1 Tax=Salix viminalis TaxID=40686 RepID=A0A6N2LZL3_SALVM
MHLPVLSISYLTDSIVHPTVLSTGFFAILGLFFSTGACTMSLDHPIHRKPFSDLNLTCTFWMSCCMDFCLSSNSN